MAATAVLSMWMLNIVAAAMMVAALFGDAPIDNAIPGLLSPWKVDGRWCSDGAVVDPVPVRSLRELGVGTVIAATVALGPASIAVGAGDAGECPSTDARGVARQRRARRPPDRALPPG